MPRYFFHVHDGVDLRDEDGTELSDIRAARVEAVRFAGEVIANDADRRSLGEDWRLEVTDEAGLILFRLDFTIAESPAAQSALRPKRPTDGPPR